MVGRVPVPPGRVPVAAQRVDAAAAAAAGGGSGEGALRVPYAPNALAGVWTEGGWDTVDEDEDEDASSFQPPLQPRAGSVPGAL
jgi:hypothetical protein